jgi:threonine dehydratase
MKQRLLPVEPRTPLSPDAVARTAESLAWIAPIQPLAIDEAPMTESKFDHHFWEQLWTKTLREQADKVARRPPNAHLTAQAAQLPPGRALDAGCGHGADTLWLAAHGWHVTAVDFSASALAHGQMMAESAGTDIAARIEWLRADLATWAPSPGHYDLVICLYVHTNGPVADLVQRMANAVAAGGTLFMVGHRPTDPIDGSATAAASQTQVSVEAAVAALDAPEWELLLAEERPRPVAGTGVDAVIRARRRARQEHRGSHVAPVASHAGLATTEAITSHYLKRILTSSVYDVAIESPLELAANLSTRIGNRLYLKREDQQPTFSFKLRGAYNKMVRLSDEERRRGVIAASAGNHAQGVALSAQRLGCRATIVMPVTTPELKIDAVRALGAEVVLSGNHYSDAYERARALEAERGAVFVHPFDDADVIAGQGTVGMEILRQHRGPLDAVFVAVGGGGLISGVAAYVKAVRPEVRVVGVQTTDSDAMARSVRDGERVTLADVGLFSDGTAVRRVGEETFRIAQALVDEFVLVDTDEVCAAIKDVFEDTRAVLEPAGALGVAGVKKYAAAHGARGLSFVTITCGANINFDRLRFVAERAELGEQREALFAVSIPEERGSFRRFCENLGARAVTEFNYRISDARQAHVFVGLSTRSREEATTIAQRFEQQGFPTTDLSGDELAKEHLRHLVGGRSPLAESERLFRFVFPERPGALMRFLGAMHPHWNISLFHYRNQGADYGRILVGIQVPDSEAPAFAEFLESLAYPYVEETENPVYRLFLR